MGKTITQMTGQNAARPASPSATGSCWPTRRRRARRGAYQLVDFPRDMPLALLAALFAAVVLVLGRWQGLKALVALGLSFAVLALFVLPAIVAGRAAAAGGDLRRGRDHVRGPLPHPRADRANLDRGARHDGSLVLIGVLGALSAAFAKLTGLDEDTATLVGLLDGPIDTRGLLLAGVVIGALGVLDDVTVTQAARCGSCGRRTRR